VPRRGFASPGPGADAATIGRRCAGFPGVCGCPALVEATAEQGGTATRSGQR